MKKKRSIGKDLVKSSKEAVKIAKGKIPVEVDFITKDGVQVLKPVSPPSFDDLEIPEFLRRAPSKK